MFGILLGFKNIFIQGVDLPDIGYGQNKDYYGYNNLFATKIINENRKKLKKIIFFYNLKHLNLIVYIKSFYNKLLLKVFKRSYWEVESKRSCFNKIYNSLGNICKKQKISLFVLSKESTLLKYKHYKFIDKKKIHKNFFYSI